jgi:carboxylesterase
MEEDAVSDEPVLPGAEPFFHDGSEVGVLVVHGFTGTTQSMRPLGAALAQRGYTVSGPRLAGHGVSPAAMARTGARDWVASAEQAFADLRARCSQVFVTGLSMGGTLTLYLAAKHPDAVAGAIPINGCVEMGGTDMAALAFDPAAPATVPGIGSDIKDPASRELAYPEVPVACFAEIHALVGVTRTLLPRIVCPTLVITSREDHVVPPLNAGIIATRIGARRVEQLWLEDSYHVATLDHDAALIAEAAAGFIRSIAGR